MNAHIKISVSSMKRFLSVLDFQVMNHLSEISTIIDEQQQLVQVLRDVGNGENRLKLNLSRGSNMTLRSSLPCSDSLHGRLLKGS